MTVLRKSYGRHAGAARHPAMEEMLVGILADGASERRAQTALVNLARYFVDWNEMRVSSACEIAAAMPGVPGAMEKALVMRTVLQRVYDAANEMALEFLNEKGPREATRLVESIEGFPERALARATVLALGHDVFPFTPGVFKVCRRLALLSEGHDYAALLEQARKLVPKQDMYEFHWLLSRHAGEVCRAAEPACDACAFRADCRAHREAAKTAARGNKGGRK